MAPIIEINDIWKQYSLGREQYQTETFREFLLRRLRLRRPKGASSDTKEFWALRGVSCEISQGDVVGVIGRNGAGKSTLLKILSRITDPTRGCVNIHGRLASLLEVGTGFHPELTGKENIFLNGAILGMKRAEILARYDEIVEFSEIEQFLDTPVKRYSSGMYVRLAFAVAAHLNPEILVVDEVLAVGDVTFQKKCISKMSEVSQGGRTVIFVSHNMAAVENLCKRGIVLNKGEAAFQGTAKDAVKYYLQSLRSAKDLSESNIVDLSNAKGRSYKSRKLLQKLEFLTDGDQPVTGPILMGSRLKIRVHFCLDAPTTKIDMGIGFDDMYRQRVFTAHSHFEPQRSHDERQGSQIFTCDIPSLPFLPGRYTIRVWLDVNNMEADLIDDAAAVDLVEADFYGTGKFPWNGFFALKHRWYHEDPVAVTTASAHRS